MQISFNGNMQKVVEFVKICEGFYEDIDVTTGRYVIDGKSIMGVAAICTTPKLDVQILTNNPDHLNKFEEAIKDFRSEEDMV